MSCTMLQVVPEPVDKWQEVRSNAGRPAVNLLDAFYRDPRRFAYTFQNYVFLTRYMQVCTAEHLGVCNNLSGSLRHLLHCLTSGAKPRVGLLVATTLHSTGCLVLSSLSYMLICKRQKVS